MISPHVVKLATDYLDQCAAENQQATLVGMHWYIDGHDKTLPLLKEVNEALMQAANVKTAKSFRRTVKKLHFLPSAEFARDIPDHEPRGI